MPSLVGEPATSVLYAPGEGSPFYVRRLLGSGQADSIAPRITRLVVDAYTVQFEEPEGASPLLAQGTVAETFGTTKAIASQASKLRNRLAAGGNYWYVSNDEPIITSQFVLLALANTTLSKHGTMQKLGWAPANCYLGNVIVSPAEQRSDTRKRRYGSAVMHTALKFGGFDMDRIVAADVLIDNPAAVAFFTNSGLTPEDTPVEPMQFEGGQTLRQVRYSGQLKHVVNTMEDRWPMLARAIVLTK